jgi:HEXXH motif-containing protein
VQLALPLVREVLHLQLGALMDLVPLHKRDSGARFHAAWRPDPHPARALLQVLYAQMGVSDFRHQEHLATPDDGLSEWESARWRAHTVSAARALLASNELTPPGREFTGEVLNALGWPASSRSGTAEASRP